MNNIEQKAQTNKYPFLTKAMLGTGLPGCLVEKSIKELECRYGDQEDYLLRRFNESYNGYFSELNDYLKGEAMALSEQNDFHYVDSFSFVWDFFDFNKFHNTFGSDEEGLYFSDLFVLVYEGEEDKSLCPGVYVFNFKNF